MTTTRFTQDKYSLGSWSTFDAARADSTHLPLAAFHRFNSADLVAGDAGLHTTDGILYVVCNVNPLIGFLAHTGCIVEVFDQLQAEITNWATTTTTTATMVDNMKHIIVVESLKVGAQLDISMVYSFVYFALNLWWSTITSVRYMVARTVQMGFDSASVYIKVVKS